MRLKQDSFISGILGSVSQFTCLNNENTFYTSPKMNNNRTLELEKRSFVTFTSRFQNKETVIMNTLLKIRI